jgi:delta 1-pyrroline-5-carboxylate dehydrogenase
VLLFDGVVSCLRTYRPQELREIIAKLNATEYQWNVGEHSRAAGRVPITYLIGFRRAPVSRG